LWLLGAALYAAIAFTSTDSDRAAPPESAAEVPQKDASRIVSEAGANASAPATQAVTNDTGQAQTTTSQFPNRETSTTLPNELAPVNTAKQNPWGQMLRGAPVHSGPDVSSAVLGYAAAGTEMQILERDLGWVKVLDPETARQGWIYEKHVAVRPDIETGTVQERALAMLSLEPPKSQPGPLSRKSHEKSTFQRSGNTSGNPEGGEL
jgi:hypothetical protein